MPNTAYTQQALAADGRFRLRIVAALLRKTADIFAEPTSTGNHAARIAFATAVIRDPAGKATLIAPYLVMRPNVYNFDTSPAFLDADLVAVNACGDADLESQILSDWDTLATLV